MTEEQLINQKFIIKGGNPLFGSVKLKGAKNAIGKIMIASLLTEEEVILSNVPLNGETEIAVEFCRHIGSEIIRQADKIRIKTPEIKNFKVEGLSRRNRLSILALGPLLARTGEVEVPMVGGDKIGARPVDFHIAALEKMGAEIKIKDTTIIATTKGLYGSSVVFPYPSVGATENTILASVLAKGRTVITNAAIEPEIIDLIKFLQKMGAIIELGSNRQIFIEGVEKLSGVEHKILPDRLEAASFAVMALATNGDILVEDAVQEHLIAFLNTVRRLGGGYEVKPDDGIRFFRKGPLQAVHIETDTYPGFATDWQQPTAVLLTQAQGNSIIHETVFEDRFGYCDDLKRMGADIEIHPKCLGGLACRFQGKLYNHSAVIRGPRPLKGTSIEMKDIRAGMAHIIAALVAEGQSEITGLEHIDRGYENIDGRIKDLGGDISRVDLN
ncbi:MAG: UDP-N-acetylglucosamine 1-carboxyvinyltransferase [Candidatus Liptonbacteria bacterium]|nr:UDP-N-acetylglucosamine 1-carboxyvinyltransferase [Candidatus Liptonbacteria bacterium]